MIIETILYIECLTTSGAKVWAKVDRSSKDQRVTWKYTVVFSKDSYTHCDSRDEAIKLFNTMVRDIMAGAGK